VLVPFAAALAEPAQRGRVVGAVMSGLLMGILLARTLAGAVASLAGWRSVYVMAAALMLGLAALLWRELPTPPRPEATSYRALMRSVLQIARSEPVVRRRALYGAAMFACFSVFWTTIAFLLTGPRYGYGEGVVGLLGLVGLVGAVMANVAGRAADAGRTRLVTGLALAGLAASFGLLALGHTSLAALLAGVVLLDAAVQAGQILNQSEIYRVRPDATSRVTTVYMAIYFAGGAVGSASAGSLYAAAGWTGVCVLGAGLALAGLAAWALEPRPARAAREPAPSAPVAGSA
jgi:predicted MFS family arabinose efflux permease